MSSSTSKLADKQAITCQLRPLHIIWDWANCPIPYSTSAKGLYDKASTFLREKKFKVSGFEGFGDTNQLNHSKYNELKTEGKIILHHIDRSEGNLPKASLQFLCDRLPPCPILIITGNRDFDGIFQALREREFDVYLAYNDLAKGLFVSQATKAWHYFDVFGIDRDTRTTKPKIGGKKRKSIRLRREKEAEAEKARKGAPEAEKGETSQGIKKPKMDQSEEEAAGRKMQRGQERKENQRQ